MMKTVFAFVVLVIAVGAKGVDLRWLDGSAPATTRPVSWGVPWGKGDVQKSATFGLTDASGKEIAIQTWPLAYWPDGSVKWTGISAVVGPEAGDSLKLIPGGQSGAAS